MRLLSACSSILTLAALCGGAEAGVLTGRVVDSNGVGVANVDIDVENNGSGGDPDVSGDFTDPNGFFTMTVTPDGLYDVSFRPPGPPSTTLLAETLVDQVVVGTVNLGTIVLDDGEVLTGRVLSGINGQPVSGVNLDVIETATGANVLLVGDTTSATGQFALAVPAGAIELRFKTAGVVGQVLAPEALPLVIGGATNLGDVTLEQGYVLSALLRTSVGNLPVAGADLDVIDTLTRNEVYTPSDNSDGAGFLDVTLAAGTYDLEFCPDFDDLLVARLLQAVSVNANTFVGTVQFDPGVVLSGQVTGAGGVPLVGVDLDLFDPLAGTGVLLCGDNTNSSGNYAVVVPTGSFNVTFTPPSGSPYGPLTQNGVSVAGNTNLSVQLSSCGSVSAYCTAGVTASGCQAQLSAVGTPSPSAPSGFTVTASGVEGQKDGLFFYGFNGPQANSWGNGSSFQCVTPPVFRVGLMNGTGSNGQCNGSFGQDMNAYWSTAGPQRVPSPGQQVNLQLWFRDPQNTSNQTTSLSNALQFDVCP